MTRRRRLLGQRTRTSSSSSYGCKKRQGGQTRLPLPPLSIKMGQRRRRPRETRDSRFGPRSCQPAFGRRRGGWTAWRRHGPMEQQAGPDQPQSRSGERHWLGRPRPVQVVRCVLVHPVTNWESAASVCHSAPSGHHTAHMAYSRRVINRSGCGRRAQRGGERAWS